MEKVDVLRDIFDLESTFSPMETSKDLISDVSEATIATENLFPIENILVSGKSDRKITTIWVSEKGFNDFKDACHISGRKTCNVIEPMMEAYVKIVKNKVLNKVDVCPFKAVEIKIGILKIEQKYEKRGPKSRDPFQIKKFICAECNEEIGWGFADKFTSYQNRRYEKFRFHKKCWDSKAKWKNW